ncbi:cytochrome P450 monooxygenase-like protein [Phyllosticta capitalensis]
MSATIFLSVVAIAAVYFFNLSRCFWANLQAAKKSGFPFICLPWDKFNIFWMVTGNFWVPLLDKLPAAITEPWLPFLRLEWTYERKYEPFALMGSEAIMFVAPGGNHLYVASPPAIADIAARRIDFQKPLERYRDVNLYGDNVVVSEGEMWRRHRKVAAPTFSEKNNRVVFEESVRQAHALLYHWTRGKTESDPLHHVDDDMMSISLHIISKAGFGVRVLWPHEESAAQEEDGLGRFASTKAPPGHALSYKDAMKKLMKNIIWVPILPKWLRQIAPFEGPKTATLAYEEWGLFMKELYDMKRIHMREGKVIEGMDLLGAIMKGAGVNEDSLNSSEPPKQLLSDSEILGNAFVFILAGHETTANAIHFSLVLLALNPPTQRRLQAELTRILGDRPSEEWDYDRDLPRIMGGMPAAVLSETMRLIPAVTGIPKSTMKDSPQTLNVNGRIHMVPAECIISLDVPATHHNPRYWPARPDISALPPGEDLDQFKPERWLTNDASRPSASSTREGSPDSQSSGGETASPNLFRPAPGTFLPFSEGHRSCLGKRFAMIEGASVLTALFHEYSVELAVDDFITDEELEKMPPGSPERREVWQKAADNAMHVLKHGMGSIITLQMRRGHVPLRVVRRGEERFAWD